MNGERDGETARHDRLQALFVEVTGGEQVRAEQESGDSSKHVDDGTVDSVSEYVATVARDDGLTDAIDGSDVDETG